MEPELTQAFKELRGDIQSVHRRLNQHDQRFDQHDQRFDRIEQRIDQMQDQLRDEMRDTKRQLGAQLGYLTELLRLVADHLGGQIESHQELMRRISVLEKRRSHADIPLQVLKVKVFA